MKNKIIFAIISFIIVFSLVGCSFKSQQSESYFESPEKGNLSINNLEMKKVLIIHSYHKEWGWNIDTEKGIRDGLEENGYILNENYELESFFMDTKISFTSPEQILNQANKAIELINNYDPDIVYVNDDNALKFVAIPYTEQNPDKKLPFVFGGINADPENYDLIDSLEKPGHSITGAVERFPYQQSFSLVKRMFPNKSKVVLFADSSESSNFLVDAFEKRYLNVVENPALEVIDVVQVSSFEKWKEKIIEYQDKADFIGTLTYHQLKDENNSVVHASEVVLWTINNNNLPEIGFLQFHAEDGFWMAVGVSPFKTGKYLGEIGSEILNGKNPSDIPIIDPKLLDVAFNLERSKMLNIDIPIDILGIASETYEEIKRPRY
jgi:ABC-type uncharacterized transport system substrate-binding protein